MKVYVVKDRKSGKYISRKNPYRPSLGVVPVLFDSPEKASMYLDILSETLYSDVGYYNEEIRSCNNGTNDVRNRLSNARASYEHAVKTNDKSLIKYAMAKVTSLDQDLGFYIRKKKELEKSLAIATKRNGVNLAVFEVDLP